MELGRLTNMIFVFMLPTLAVADQATEGKLPVHEAAKAASLERVQALLDAGEDINKKDE